MKKITTIALLLITLVAIHGCIDHPKGTGGTSNILLYSDKSISENVSNDGTFDATIEVTVTGTEFVTGLGEGDFGTLNKPNGLTIVLSRVSATKASIHISGQVTDEEACGDGQMKFFFEESAFTSGSRPISFEVPIAIKYIRPTLSYSLATLNENANNLGGFSQNIVVTAEGGGAFSQTTGTLDAAKYEWFDLPTGLTSVITVNSATQATITFTGAATLSTPVNDIKANLLFKTEALSDNFCIAVPKKGFEFEFYRSVIMYSVPMAGVGNLGNRAGADAACVAAKPVLPDDYNGARAFLSTAALDVVDLPSQTLSFDDSVEVEGAGPTPRIAASWNDLFTTNLINSLSAADVVDPTTLYWTGSTDAGVSVPETCVDWTSSAGANHGQVGNADAVDGTWLTNGDVVEDCDELHHLLCIAFVRN